MYRITCTCLFYAFLGALCSALFWRKPTQGSLWCLNIHLVSCILYLFCHEGGDEDQDWDSDGEDNEQHRSGRGIGERVGGGGQGVGGGGVGVGVGVRRRRRRRWGGPSPDTAGMRLHVEQSGKIMKKNSRKCIPLLWDLNFFPHTNIYGQNFLKIYSPIVWLNTFPGKISLLKKT